MSEAVMVYRWGNNPKRATLKGRLCRVVERLTQNSALVEFVDNGQREVVSRNSLSRAKKGIDNAVGIGVI